MASNSGSSSSNLKAALIVLFIILGYILYDAIMSTAAEMLQRLLIISPLLLVILVHWISTPDQISIPIPGSEDAIHRAGGSPWGVAFVLVLLMFLISYQPSLNGLMFYAFMTLVSLRMILF